MTKTFSEDSWSIVTLLVSEVFLQRRSYSDTHYDQQCLHIANPSRKNGSRQLMIMTHNEHSHALPPLRLSTHVRVQNPISKRWDRQGIIIGIGRHRDYHVKLPSGRVYWRNRRFLRTTRSSSDDDDNADDSESHHDDSDESQTAIHSAPRRSTRRRTPRK